MWRDHLRSFWRGVANNKLTTCINVGGLALGLAVFFALTFYVQREFSWDAQWQDAERIYTGASLRESRSENSIPIRAFTPYVIGETLQQRNPDAFETYARIFRDQGEFNIEGEAYSNRQLSYVEPSLLQLVQLETVEGSLQDVFVDPRSLAISAKAAQVLFGEESPLGRRVTFSSQRNGSADYAIKAVYRVPEPSVLSDIQFMAVLDLAALPVPNASVDTWAPPEGTSFLSVEHYFKVRPGVAVAPIEADLRAFMDENRYLETSDVKTRFTFMPLRDLHLMPTLFDSGSNVERLRIIAGIGALVLLISGCNFVMLATLRSIDRMREVGIRKTIGGEAGQLMRQYLVDVFLQTFIAALLALALLELALPGLQARLNLPLELELFNGYRLGQCLVVVTGFTLLSGLYPAVLMSRGQPARILRDSGSGTASNGNALRRLLVGIQFAIVIGLLLTSTVVRQQIDYTRNRDRGYKVENIIGVQAGGNEKSSTLIAEFKRIPGVVDAAVGQLTPGSILLSTSPRFTFTDTACKTTEGFVQAMGVGAGYLGLMSVPILAGREFLPEIEGVSSAGADGQAIPDLAAVVLNLSAARALGFASADEAVDRLVTREVIGTDGEPRAADVRVIGVVADTQFSSVLLPPVPQYYYFNPRSGWLVVKLEPAADQAAVMAGLRAAWASVMGQTSFLPLTPDMFEPGLLEREEFEARVVTGSTILALIIALLGLYGLVEATVAKRVKEIGVRKVMGAGNTSIVSLLIWQFSQPIVIANLVAWPLGFWGVSRWLQRFPYQLDTGVIAWSAVAASLVALLIAWLTIGLMAARAASAKPVLALRYE
jgi:putative ABC transport system permease protein